MKSFAITLMVAIVFGSGLASVQPAYADDTNNAVQSSDDAATDSSIVQTIETRRIRKYADGVNRPCPEGNHKMFIIDVHVHKNSLGFIERGEEGVGEIVTKNDREIHSDTNFNMLDNYMVSYYFYAPSRMTKVKKDPRENSVTWVASGPNMWYVIDPLRMDCLEELEDGQE